MRMRPLRTGHSHGNSTEMLRQSATSRSVVASCETRRAAMARPGDTQKKQKTKKNGKTEKRRANASWLVSLYLVYYSYITPV